MSNEMESAFAALTVDTDRVRLAPAPAVRKRSDRRMVVQAVAGAAAVAVLVAGVTVGTRMMLAGPGTPGPIPAATTPAPSTAPPPTSPNPSPSTSASAPASEPAGRPMPRSIPASAFLQGTDVPGDIKEPPSDIGSNDIPFPSLCRSNYMDPGRIGIRGTRYLSFTSHGAPADSTPKAAVYEHIAVYRGPGAAAFMTNIRAAVRACPSQTDDTGVRVRYYSRGPLGGGDDSELIDVARPMTNDDGSPVGDGSQHHTYWAAVRVGDTVALVADGGWESGSGDRADSTHLGTRAAARLAAWRG
jgi:hypothetical protein